MSSWTGREMHQHYLKGGIRNVQIRDNINLLARDQHGKLPADIEGMARSALYHAGVTDNDWIVDTGSGYPPFFLGWLRLNGHNPKRLLAVEPNIPRHRERPPYQPKDFAGIHVIRAYGGALPLKNAIAKVVVAHRSLYHMDEAGLEKFHEAVQAVLQPDGILDVWTRGERYKEKIGDDEVEVCTALSESMGSAVTGPSRLQTGFTSEKARPWLQEHFAHVVELRQRGDILFDGTLALRMLFDHHLTLTDMYEDEQGNSPTRQQHVEALRWVMRDRIAGIETGMSPMIDTLDESLFLASNSPIRLPENLGFAPLTGTA